jgi:hypothetical protein
MIPRITGLLLALPGIEKTPQLQVIPRPAHLVL